MKRLKPTPLDIRDRHFRHARLFGITTSFPDEFDVELGMRIPDQNADGRPSECTGYTVTDIAADQDGFLYSPDFNFSMTLKLMGVGSNNDGADLRQAFKVPVAFGLLPLDDEPAGLFTKTQAYAANPANWPADAFTTAATFKKPAYIPVAPTFGQDWFDAVRSAMLGGRAANEKRPIGVGTRWSQDFEGLLVNATLPESPQGLVWGHAYKVCGWSTFHGQPFLKLKTWQGDQYGKGGYVWCSRKLFNKLMSDWGTYAATLQDVPTGSVAELKSKISLLEDVIARLMVWVQKGYIAARYGMAA